MRVLLILVLLTACSRGSSEPDPQYQKATKALQDTISKTLDPSYSDPAFDAVEAMFRAVPESAPERDAAIQLADQIKAARDRRREHQEELTQPSGPSAESPQDRARAEAARRSMVERAQARAAAARERSEQAASPQPEAAPKPKAAEAPKPAATPQKAEAQPAPAPQAPAVDAEKKKREREACLARQKECFGKCEWGSPEYQECVKACQC